MNIVEKSLNTGIVLVFYYAFLMSLLVKTNFEQCLVYLVRFAGAFCFHNWRGFSSYWATESSN